MSKRKKGIFRQPRRDYSPDISISRIDLNQESLCKVSNFEFPSTSTYNIPQISEADNCEKMQFWFYKNYLAEVKQERERTVVEVHICRKSSSTLANAEPQPVKSQQTEPAFLPSYSSIRKRSSPASEKACRRKHLQINYSDSEASECRKITRRKREKTPTFEDLESSIDTLLQSLSDDKGKQLSINLSRSSRRSTPKSRSASDSASSKSKKRQCDTSYEHPQRASKHPYTSKSKNNSRDTINIVSDRSDIVRLTQLLANSKYTKNSVKRKANATLSDNLSRQRQINTNTEVVYRNTTDISDQPSVDLKQMQEEQENASAMQVPSEDSLKTKISMNLGEMFGSCSFIPVAPVTYPGTSNENGDTSGSITGISKIFGNEAAGKNSGDSLKHQVSRELEELKIEMFSPPSFIPAESVLYPTEAVEVFERTVIPHDSTENLVPEEMQPERFFRRMLHMYYCEVLYNNLFQNKDPANARESFHENDVSKMCTLLMNNYRVNPVKNMSNKETQTNIIPNCKGLVVKKRCPLFRRMIKKTSKKVNSDIVKPPIYESVSLSTSHSSLFTNKETLMERSNSLDSVTVKKVKKRKHPMLAKYWLERNRTLTKTQHKTASPVRMKDKLQRVIKSLRAYKAKNSDDAIVTSEASADDGSSTNDENCEKYVVYLKQVKGCFVTCVKSYHAFQQKIDGKRLDNMQTETFKAAGEASSVETNNESEMAYSCADCYMVNMATQTFPLKSPKAHCWPGDSVRKSTCTTSPEMEDKATQMYDYLTPNEIYCRNWIQKNLFHIDDLNPYTTITDVRISHASTTPCMTSDNDSTSEHEADSSGSDTFFQATESF